VSKQTIDISAVQLRRQGDELQVLVETDGVWRLAITRPWPADGTGLISHIAEADGKFRWPAVHVTEVASTVSTSGCVPCAGCGGMRKENCKDFPRHGHDWCDCQ